MGGGASIPFKEDAHVVIVGGGYAGVLLAVNIRKMCKITLIDPKDSFVHNVAALRACVDADFAKNVFVPYEKTFGDSFVRGKVVSVNKEAKSVTLDTGKEVSYTHLVLATGSASPFPGKVTKDHPNVSRDEGLELYKAMNQEIVKAESIVCVGGGAVGVELSGEIKTDFPGKNVVLVHAHEVLCSTKLQVKVQKNLKTALEKKGIKLMLGKRVANLSDIELNKCAKGQILKTEDGEDIEADLVLPCTGSKFATDVFREALGEAVTEKGQVKVDGFFKVDGTENIFAIGDITNIEEEKMAYAAGNHAELMAKNLQAEFQGCPKKEYKPADFIMLIPVGRNGGVGELMGVAVGDFVCKMLKSKSLFVSKYWGVMGQPTP